MKDAMIRPTFAEWFHEVALTFKPGVVALPAPTLTVSHKTLALKALAALDSGPPDSPEVPGGMINVFFASFINGWWEHRHKSNVLFLHFADMKVGVLSEPVIAQKDLLQLCLAPARASDR